MSDPRRLARGARRVVSTMQELSAVAGLSRPTLSKYFADPASVRPATRARIEGALARVDYAPNLLAMNLDRRRSRLLGVLVPTLGDPFFAELVRRVEEAAAAAGYLAVTQSAHGLAAEQARLLRQMRSLGVAGAVVAPMDAPGGDAALAALARAVPVALADSRAGLALPFAGTRNAESVARIAGYLCDTTPPGGGPPLLLAMPGVNRNAAERRAGFEAELRRRGLAPRVVEAGADPGREGGGWDFEAAGRAAMRRLLAEGLPRGATVLCANDRLAIGALAAAWEAGVRVGRDAGPGGGAWLRVAGHDDNPLSAHLCPPLTTVRQDVAAIGRAAVELLVAAIERTAEGAATGTGQTSGPEPEAGGAPPPERLLGAELVIRESA